MQGKLMIDTPPEVVTFGETMVLMSPMADGPLRYVHTFEKRIGGAESNVCVGLARLGRRARWVSSLGDDEFGRFVWQSLRGEGVDVSRVHFDAEHPTGVYFKERRGLGMGEVYYYRAGSAASHMTPDMLRVEDVAKARYLLVSGITPALSPSCLAMTEQAVSMAKDAGVTVVFDPNLRLKLWSEEEARKTLTALLRQADIVLPGEDEAAFLTGHTDRERAGRQLLEEGPQSVVMKTGADGALVFSQEKTTAVPGFAVPRIVDPVGAGDAFAAGFLTGLLEGRSPEQSARIGNACGAFALTVPGDVEGLPDRRELDRMLAMHDGADGFSQRDVTR